MPTLRQKDPARALDDALNASAADRVVEPKPAKQFGRVNPDFAGMAGWRTGFDSPIHKATIVRALRSRSALCPGCRFDLINQRRPDCPECGMPIDPDAVLYQDAPPGPLLIRTLAAAAAFCWLAMIVGGFAWTGAAKAVALTALFALQLACGWVLLTVYTDTTWYRGISSTRRRHLLVASVAAAAIAGAAAIAAVATLI